MAARETRNLLCTPMIDSSSARVGCVLAVNKKKGFVECYVNLHIREREHKHICNKSANLTTLFVARGFSILLTLLPPTPPPPPDAPGAWDRCFTQQDEAWLKIVSTQYGQILSNYAKHQKTLRQRDYYGSLFVL